jgi:drug/metabolite transporter (DMT)-like permease
MTSPQGRPATRERRLWPPLVIVYLAWGSTYLAIRVMVETVPPLFGAGLRFIAAGMLLCAVLLALGGKTRLRIDARQAVAAAVVGTLVLGGGIGLLTLAERRVPSGLAALVIATVPLWIVVLRLLARERVPRTTLAGVFVGFVGVAILVLPADGTAGSPFGWLAVLLAAALFTAIGAMAADRLTLPDDTLLSTALEMGVAGGVLLVAAVAANEPAQLDPDELSSRSLAAFAYLVLIGSLLAYSAFVWLLQNADPSTVATYAYVNPAVALLLGWAVLSEEITLTILTGALLVLASVVVSVRGDDGDTRKSSGVR